MPGYHVKSSDLKIKKQLPALFFHIPKEQKQKALLAESLL
jgi:hypothetical protein